MAKIGDWAEAFDFGCDYLKETHGSPTEFRQSIEMGKQRLGQAFFNALNGFDQAKLNGSLFDPFHRPDPKAIWDAIAFLMDH